MPNRINKASLPPNLYRLLSTILSNLMDRTILCRASDRSLKKVKFRGIFRGKFAEKSTDFTGIFAANLAENQSVKTGRFCGYFPGKLRQRSIGFCADQTSVFDVFLTESSFALSTTIRSRTEPMAKPLTSWLVPSFSQRNQRLVVSELRDVLCTFQRRSFKINLQVYGK